MTTCVRLARGELAERIHAAALEEFATRGYGASLQAIAEAAGTTKANVLYHFGSKEQLATAVLEPASAAVLELARRLDAGEEFDAALAAADLMLANRLAVRLLVFHHDSLPDPDCANSFLEVIDRLAARLDPSDPAAPTRCVIALIGIAYTLSVTPARADAAPKLDNRHDIAELIRQLTLAPDITEATH